MKFRSQTFTILISSALIMTAACNSAAENKEATTAEAITMSDGVQGIQVPIDTAASIIKWKGSKLIGGSHLGTIPISQGVVSLSDTGLIAGELTIDMKNLQPTDQDEASNGKLKAHLCSSDFFSVDSFPYASFKIASIVRDSSLSQNNDQTSGKDAEITPNSKVTGNLTIKGITKSISIPAEIHADTTGVQFKAAFSIDRTLWGVNYGAENSVKDKIINKNIDFEIDIIAKK